MNCIIGDIVEFDENEKVITGIDERKNFLYRPLLANIDFIGILFSIVSPEFNFNVFQKMLLNACWQNIPAILIISKIDLVEKNTLDKFLNEIRDNQNDYFWLSNLILNYYGNLIGFSKNYLYKIISDEKINEILKLIKERIEDNQFKDFEVNLFQKNK